MLLDPPTPLPSTSDLLNVSTVTTSGCVRFSWLESICSKHSMIFFLCKNCFWFLFSINSVFTRYMGGILLKLCHIVYNLKITTICRDKFLKKCTLFWRLFFFIWNHGCIKFRRSVSHTIYKKSCLCQFCRWHLVKQCLARAQVSVMLHNFLCYQGRHPLKKRKRSSHLDIAQVTSMVFIWRGSDTPNWRCFFNSMASLYPSCFNDIKLYCNIKTCLSHPAVWWHKRRTKSEKTENVWDWIAVLLPFTMFGPQATSLSSSPENTI